LIPLAFAASLTVALAAWAVHPLGKWLLAAVAGTYLVANLAASLQVAWTRKDARYALLMPGLFACLHLGYGFGSLWGLLLAALLLVKRAAGKVAGTAETANTAVRKESQ
jgi:hypothetical protein